MARLVFYSKERTDWFPDAYNKTLKNWQQAEIVVEKLIRHFKAGSVRVDWTSGNRNPKAFGYYRILLNYNHINFGVICHEVAHIIEVRKSGHSRHNKRFKKVMKKVVNYCKRKVWFEQELIRRTAPKPVKPEPTKEELKTELILRLENNCKRYQTKLKLYSHKLKKTQKKILRLQKR